MTHPGMLKEKLNLSLPFCWTNTVKLTRPICNNVVLNNFHLIWILSGVFEQVPIIPWPSEIVAYSSAWGECTCHKHSEQQITP